MASTEGLQENRLSDLRRWLNSEDGYAVLEDAAKSILRWAERENLPSDVLLLDSTSLSKNERLHSVSASIWEIIYNPTRLKNCRLQLSDSLQRQDVSGIRSILISRVRDYCRDEQRKEANSPFRYLYRRISNTLSLAARENQASLQYDYDGKAAFYAYSKSKNLKKLSSDFFAEEKESDNQGRSWRGWPHPGFALDEIRKAVVQREIARSFWQLVLEELQRKSIDEYLLPVHDLVSYIDGKYGLKSIFGSCPNTQVGNVGENLPDPTEQLHQWTPQDPFMTSEKQTSTAENNIICDQEQRRLKSEALKCLSSWTPEMQKGFYMKNALGMNYLEISRVINLSRYKAKKCIEDAESRIRQKYFQIEITSAIDEFAEDGRLFFSEAIKDFICKNHTECRDKG